MRRWVLGAALCLLAACLLSGCMRRTGWWELYTEKKAADKVEEALDLAIVECPEGYWVYDGRLFEQEAGPGEEGYQPYLLIRSHTEVYGYDMLDEAAQHAFDLCYGEYFSGDIREDGKRFFHFTMPEPLTKVEWQNASALYGAAASSDSYRPFRYECGDLVTGKVNCLGDACPCKRAEYDYHFYVGGGSWSDPELNTAYDRLADRANEILAEIDPDLSEAEICEYIARYLTDHVTYYTNYYWETKTFGEITVVNSDDLFTTAYGALADGKANCFGYARAFDYLAKRAGLTSIVVTAYNENDPIGHAWNMVQVDGVWYQLDATWMDNDTEEPDMSWFLFGAGEPAHDYYNIQTYARTTIPLPQCAAEAYLWPSDALPVLSEPFGVITAGTSFTYNDKEYNLQERESSVNALMSKTQVGNILVVEGHISPNAAYYGIFDTDTETFVKDIIGANFTWRDNDITTAVYNFGSQIYNYESSLLSDLELGEYEYIDNLVWTDRRHLSAEICSLTDAPYSLELEIPVEKQ